MDLRVGAVPFHTDLGLDRRSVSTDLLKNITIICLPKVLGAAASCLERGEFRPQLQRRVDTGVICRAIGKPLVCSRSFALPSVSSVRSNFHSPLRKVGPSYAKLSEPAANSAHAAAIESMIRRGTGLNLSSAGTIWVIAPSRIEHQLVPTKNKS